MKDELLKLELIKLQEILYNEFNSKYRYEDIDNSIKILNQKNKKQYCSIANKINNFSRILYETGVLNNLNDNIYEEFIKVLKNVEDIVNSICSENNTKG
ncbi:hypothetical protein ACQ1Q5_02790 [Ornithobacterium rhinotracheale]